MMSILAKLRSDMRAATLGRDYTTQSITKVILGEVDRANKSLSDNEVISIVKKMIESNKETISYSSSPDILNKLNHENSYLSTLLPKTLSSNEILESLQPHEPEIKSAKTDGMGTGIAMKYLKSNELSVDGKEVANVVKIMRSQ